MLRVAGVAQRITPRAHLDRRAHPVVQPQRCQRRLKSTATVATLTASATLSAAATAAATAAAAAAGGEAYRCGRLPLVRAQLPRDVHLARVRMGWGLGSGLGLGRGLRWGLGLVVVACAGVEGTASAPPLVAAAAVDAAADHARRFVMKLWPAKEDMLYSPDGATVP